MEESKIVRPNLANFLKRHSISHQHGIDSSVRNGLFSVSLNRGTHASFFCSWLHEQGKVGKSVILRTPDFSHPFRLHKPREERGEHVAWKPGLSFPCPPAFFFPLLGGISGMFFVKPEAEAENRILVAEQRDGNAPPQSRKMV